MSELDEVPHGATPLAPDELEGLKFRHLTTREQLDELEQTNIELGLRWLARHRGEVLTDEFVVTLHRRLFGDIWDWAGAFRRTGKNIGVDPIQIAVQLRSLVDDARYWVGHKTYPASEAAVRLHHRLVQIHPFANGNGRHARIFADHVLLRVYGAKPIDWAGGHDLQTMNPRRSAYIEALRCADRGDFGPLFRFVGPRDDLT